MSKVQPNLTDSIGRFALVLYCAASPMAEAPIGTVSDASGARTPKASITVLNESTDSSSLLGQVVHAEAIAELPLNGRDFVQLGALQPGAFSLDVNGMRVNDEFLTAPATTRSTAAPSELSRQSMEFSSLNPR